MGQLRHIVSYGSSQWINAVDKLTTATKGNEPLKLKVDESVIWEGYATNNAQKVAAEINNAKIFALAKRDLSLAIARKERLTDTKLIILADKAQKVGSRIHEYHQSLQATYRKIDAVQEKHSFFAGREIKLRNQEKFLSAQAANLRHVIGEFKVEHKNIETQIKAHLIAPLEVTDLVEKAALVQIRKPGFDIKPYVDQVFAQQTPAQSLRTAKEWIAQLDTIANAKK